MESIEEYLRQAKSHEGMFADLNDETLRMMIAHLEHLRKLQEASMNGPVDSGLMQQIAM